MTAGGRFLGSLRGMRKVAYVSGRRQDDRQGRHVAMAACDCQIATAPNGHLLVTNGLNGQVV
jgi:hypothetical protein